MRAIPPPMTEREISTFTVSAFEKVVGEMELRLGRRASYAYTERERRRDRLRLADARRQIREHTDLLAAMDRADRAAARRAG